MYSYFGIYFWNTKRLLKPCVSDKQHSNVTVKKNLIGNGHNKVKTKKKNPDMVSYIIRRGSLQETY